MQSSLIQPNVLERKLKILSLPAPFTDVNVVQVAYQKIIGLIDDIDKHLKSDQLDSATIRLLQKKRIQLETQKVKCAEFLDEKGYLLVETTQTLVEDGTGTHLR